MSVDLPEPDGPMMAVSRPRLDVERDAAQRVNRAVALAVVAGEVRGRPRPLCASTSVRRSAPGPLVDDSRLHALLRVGWVRGAPSHLLLARG